MYFKKTNSKVEHTEKMVKSQTSYWEKQDGLQGLNEQAELHDDAEKLLTGLEKDRLKFEN